MLSHFILDLRSIYLKECSTTQTNQQLTSVKFAANIQGNLGASLDTSWATGEERETEEEQMIWYSDNPLATGLLGTEENTRQVRAFSYLAKADIINLKSYW